MQLTTDALVIRTMDVGESDRLLTLLTKDYGVIKAFASSAKKIKSKYYSATSFLCYSHFSLDEVKDSYRVRDAVLNRCLFKLGCDVETISLQQYFCEVMAYFSPLENESEIFLRLLLNACHLLNENKLSPSIIKAVFELKVLSFAGFMPDLTVCNSCGSENDIYFFNYNEGVVFCEECAFDRVNGVVLDKTVLSAMRHIINSDFERIFSFSIPLESAKRLSKITERYLITQTEHNFKALDFYNEIV